MVGPPYGTRLARCGWGLRREESPAGRPEAEAARWIEPAREELALAAELAPAAVTPARGKVSCLIDRDNDNYGDGNDAQSPSLRRNGQSKKQEISMREDRGGGDEQEMEASLKPQAEDIVESNAAQQKSKAYNR